MPAATRTPLRGGDMVPDWARYLTDMRTQRGLSARQAATRMGVTPQTWSGIEAGTRIRNGTRVPVIPKDDTLHRAANALALTPSERRHLFALAHPADQARQPWQTRLKLARVAASVTEVAAARAAGVTIATYREWERQGSRVPKHECLRALLTHLRWTPLQIADFMNDVPPDTTPARAPRQPTNPVSDLPRWSQFITAKRVAQGLYLTQVDARLGQQSVLRRFELGGWPRSDGRLSVPCIEWLDRIAEALDMTSEETAQLHLLADHHRLTVAAEGPRPLAAELFQEARKAVDLTTRAADTLTGLRLGTWGRLERGHPDTLAALTPATLAVIVETLPVRPLLSAALHAALPHLVPNSPEPADIPSGNQPADTSYAACG